jgi:hypothetical protein
MLFRMKWYHKDYQLSRFNQSINMNTEVNFNAIYIMNMLSYKKDNVIEIFASMGIGRVGRIDLFENDGDDRISAMVYLKAWYDTPLAKKIHDTIDDPMECYKLQLGGYNYLVLKKDSSCEIPETQLNIHQVAFEQQEQCQKISQLEYKVFEQGLEIQFLKEKLEMLMTMVGRPVGTNDSMAPMTIDELVVNQETRWKATENLCGNN